MTTANHFDVAAPAWGGFFSLLFAALAWSAWFTTSWQPLEWTMYAYLGMGLFLWASYFLLWVPGVLGLVEVTIAIVRVTSIVFLGLCTLHTGWVLLRKAWRWMER